MQTTLCAFCFGGDSWWHPKQSIPMLLCRSARNAFLPLLSPVFCPRAMENTVMISAAKSVVNTTYLRFRQWPLFTINSLLRNQEKERKSFLPTVIYSRYFFEGFSAAAFWPAILLYIMHSLGTVKKNKSNMMSVPLTNWKVKTLC
jgi:hypothetical protein